MVVFKPKPFTLKLVVGYVSKWGHQEADYSIEMIFWWSRFLGLGCGPQPVLHQSFWDNEAWVVVALKPQLAGACCDEQPRAVMSSQFLAIFSTKWGAKGRKWLRGCSHWPVYCWLIDHGWLMLDKIEDSLLVFFTTVTRENPSTPWVFVTFCQWPPQ